MPDKIARFLSFIFHPVLIPTWGLVFYFFGGFFPLMLPLSFIRYAFLVVFFTTFVLPLLAISVLAFNPRFDVKMPKSTDRLIPLTLSAVFYYLGYVLLGHAVYFPVIRFFLLGSIGVIVGLLVISFWWKISNHAAAIGGMTGAFFAYAFRSGLNPVYSLVAMVLISGLVSTARLALQKHTLKQVLAGYLLGFVILYSVMYFS